MKLFELIDHIFKKKSIRAETPQPKFLITEGSLGLATAAIQPKLNMKHEGILFLLGRTDGEITIATNVYLPNAKTTKGSFEVEAREVGNCAKLAGKYELQIVAKIHTHPDKAFHSGGDISGANNKYTGFVSVVVPHYGAHLPSLKNSVSFMWVCNEWKEIKQENVIVIPGEQIWKSHSF